MSKITELFNQAVEAQKQCDYVGAMVLYTAVLDTVDASTSQAETLELRLAALRRCGLLQRRLGKQEAALASYRQMLQEAKTQKQIVVGKEMVAQQLGSMGRHEQAMPLHREAMQLAKEINYSYGRALVLQGIGLIQFYLSHFEEALSSLQKSLSVFQQITEDEEVSRVWNTLGMVYFRLGKVDKGVAAYEKALPLARHVGQMETAIALSNLGEAYQHLYDMEQAFVYHQEAMSIFETIQTVALEVDTRRNLGVDLMYLGEMEAGIVHLRQSLQMSETIGEPYLTHQALYSLALAEQVQGQNDEAEVIANRLLKSAAQNQARDFQAQAMYVLGLCAQTRADGVTAEQMWQQALFLAHETGQQMLLWQLHAALAEIAPNPALAATHYRIAKDVIDQIVYPIDDNALRQKFLKAPPVAAILDQVA